MRAGDRKSPLSAAARAAVLPGPPDLKETATEPAVPLPTEQAVPIPTGPAVPLPTEQTVPLPTGPAVPLPTEPAALLPTELTAPLPMGPTARLPMEPETGLYGEMFRQTAETAQEPVRKEKFPRIFLSPILFPQTGGGAG